MIQRASFNAVAWTRYVYCCWKYMIISYDWLWNDHKCQAFLKRADWWVLSSLMLTPAHSITNCILSQLGLLSNHNPFVILTINVFNLPSFSMKGWRSVHSSINVPKSPDNHCHLKQMVCWHVNAMSKHNDVILL